MAIHQERDLRGYLRPSVRNFQREAYQRGRADFKSSCHRLPIRPYFQDVFISDELGAQKPEKAFFERAFLRIPDFNVADALIVGDSLSSDIRGGILMGIDTCWLNPCDAKAPDGMKITYTVKRLEDTVPLVLGT